MDVAGGRRANQSVKLSAPQTRHCNKAGTTHLDDSRLECFGVCELYLHEAYMCGSQGSGQPGEACAQVCRAPVVWSGSHSMTPSIFSTTFLTDPVHPASPPEASNATRLGRPTVGLVGRRSILTAAHHSAHLKLEFFCCCRHCEHRGLTSNSAPLRSPSEIHQSNQDCGVRMTIRNPTGQ